MSHDSITAFQHAKMPVECWQIRYFPTGNTLEVSPEYLLCDSLVPTACNASSNVTEPGVLQLRKNLYDALVIVDRLGGE